MQNQMLLERINPVVVAVPIDTTGAAVASDWVNLRVAKRCVFLIIQGAWAGGTPAVTLEQATSAAGAGNKALEMDYYYSRVALTGGTWTKTAITSDTFNLTATANTYTAIEIMSTMLDTNNGFTHAQCKVASPGANADLICVVALLGDLHHQSRPTLLESPIA